MYHISVLYCRKTMKEDTKRTIIEYSSVNHYARLFKFFRKYFTPTTDVISFPLYREDNWFSKMK